MNRRMGMGMFLAAAMAIGGCATPAQRAARAEAKKQKQQLAAQQKQQKLAADQQKKQAEAQAKEAAHQQKLAADQAKKEAEHQKKLAAEQQKKQADEQKRLAEQQKHDAEQQRLAAEQAKKEAAEQQQKMPAEQERVAAQNRQMAMDQQAMSASEQKKAAKAEQKRLEEERKHQEQLAAQRAKEEAEYNKQWRNDGIGHEVLQPDNETRLLNQWVRAQAAAGAREDAMLYAAHFDGDQLNSLGRAKLDLILSGAPTDRPIMVYVAGAQQAAQARVAAVTDYWKASSYSNVQLQTKEGVNYDVTTPASVGLGALHKLEKESGSSTVTNGTGTGTRSSSSGSSGGQ